MNNHNKIVVTKNMAKEVQSQHEKKFSQNTRLDLLNSIKKGFSPTHFAKNNDIKKGNLSYHLSVLREQGLIRKIGYGVWEATERSSVSTKDPKLNLEVRGHAFMWKLKIPKRLGTTIPWKTRLIKHSIPYKLVGIKKTPRIIIDNKKIWLGKKHIIVFDNVSHFGIHSAESRKYAVIDLLETLNKLENALKVDLRPYLFAPRREHYALVKNSLAIQCNKKKEKIKIRDKDGYWLEVDDSYGLGELETNGKGSFETNPQLQNWWNDQKRTNFEVTPKFITESIAGVTKNQMMFAENMESHIKAIQELGRGVRELTKKVKELKK